MRTVTRYVYDVEFVSPHDPPALVSTLRAAARGWAKCSNDSEPLLSLADQIESQGYPEEAD